MRTRELIIIGYALLITAPAFAGLTLAADDPPSELPWEKPATLAYVRNGDGSSNATVDAVLRYKVSDTSMVGTTAKKSAYAFGVYLHRDSDDSAPRNDRGVQASYGQSLVPDLSNSAGVFSLNWQAKASFGKTLQMFKDMANNDARVDRRKDRQTLMVGGYYQPTISGTPPRPGSTDRSPMVMFFDGATGFYSDNSQGGSGQGVGRLTGGMLTLGANFAPLGLDPEFSKLGSLGVVPTFRLSAQVQRDLAASGDRMKATRKFYTAELSFAFAKVGSGSGIAVPSLNISRSVGADVLVGRTEFSKTEISLGLTF